MNPLESFGRSVAEEQDRDLAEQGTAEAAVQKALDRRTAPKRRVAVGFVVAFALLASVAVAFIMGSRVGSDPVSTAPVPVEAVPSALVASSEDAAFAFEDGTTILLAKGGEGHVVETHELGGEVNLDNGRMRVSVPPHRGRQWAFSAGPYRVQVKGTRFDLAWDAESGKFNLEMLDGSVQVLGPDMAPRLVVAGQSLHLPLTRPVVPEAPTASPSAEPSAKPAESAAPLTLERSARPTGPSFQSLALDGKYKDAVDTAVAQGFEGILQSSSASDLLLLGDACRLAGKSALAIQTYNTIRERHKGSVEAQRATFSLGVASFPQASAIPFFEQYLQDAPNGPLAPEALGRILEVRHRGGDKAAAIAAAKRYLARYPKEGHSRLAQSILDGGDAPKP